MEGSKKAFNFKLVSETMRAFFIGDIRMPRASRLAKERAKKKEEEVKANPSRAFRKAKNPDKVMVKELARSHTEVAINELVRLMKKSRSDQIRLDAAEAILNRGWGKPVNAIAGADGEGPVQVIGRIERVFVKSDSKDRNG